MLIFMVVGAIFFTTISNVKIYANDDMSSESLFMNDEFRNQSNESINYFQNQTEDIKESNLNSNVQTIVKELNNSEDNDTKVIKTTSSGGSSGGSGSYIITAVNSTPSNETNSTRNCTRDNPCLGDYTIAISITDHYDNKSIVIGGSHIDTKFIKETFDLVHTTFDYIPRGCYPIRTEGVGDETNTPDENNTNTPNENATNNNTEEYIEYEMIQVGEDVYIENESNINYLYYTYNGYQKAIRDEFAAIVNETTVYADGVFGKDHGRIYMIMYIKYYEDFLPIYQYWGLEINAETLELIKYKELNPNNRFNEIWW